ncbi:MAG: glutamate-5-semialdehyde dehydrogenase [Alphaproteobacteria bacterium]|jgi:glutamate-5-semialdehyde dehydrogenase|nr:glutamate-5-semialdehyde dehydrogenase [Alphaproteobacteria bacterium]
MSATQVTDDHTQAQSLEADMAALGTAAREAARVLAVASADVRRAALNAAAAAIRARAADILNANGKDMAAAEESGLSGSMLDRLRLDDGRIEGMAAGIEEVATLDDPVGRVLDVRDRPNGLHIERVAVPIGVIAIIYESRPNVTADAGALCLMSGNVAVLRGGSESFHSSRAIVGCLHDGLVAAGLPQGCIQLVPTTDRAAVGLLVKMEDDIDLVVPRGGRSLIERLMNESRIPVLAHLDGICHTYVHAAAAPDMARDVVLNAKMRRTGICGATETLLIDAAVVDALPGIVTPLIDAGCEVRGDAAARAADPRIGQAEEADWGTEYLEAIISVRVVPGLDAAIDHINRYGSHHTESVITADDAAADRFMAEVDSGIVMHNTSTQFADGGQFGMGAEIGISTGKLHARGPVGVEQLTTYKYKVRGTGQVRP